MKAEKIMETPEFVAKSVRSLDGLKDLQNLWLVTEIRTVYEGLNS